VKNTVGLLGYVKGPLLSSNHDFKMALTGAPESDGHPTLNFGSYHDLGVMRWSPSSALHSAGSLILSLPLSFCPPIMLSLK